MPHASTHALYIYIYIYTHTHTHTVSVKKTKTPTRLCMSRSPFLLRIKLLLLPGPFAQDQCSILALFQTKYLNVNFSILLKQQNTGVVNILLICLPQGQRLKSKQDLPVCFRMTEVKNKEPYRKKVVVIIITIY